MEATALVALAFRFLRQFGKVRRRLRHCFAEEANDYPAQLLTILLYVEEHLQRQCLRHVTRQFLHLLGDFGSFWLFVACLFQRRRCKRHVSAQERVDTHILVL